MHSKSINIDYRSKGRYTIHKGKSGLTTTINAVSVAESRAYHTAITKADNSIKADTVETGILIDRNGNVIFTVSQGSPNSVNFTPDQLKKMKDATLTHNHPRGSTFSYEDIGLLVTNDLFAIRATSVNHTYQLERLKGMYPSKGLFASDFLKASSANKAVCDAEYSKIEHLQYGSPKDVAKYNSECDRLNKKLDKMNHQWLRKNAKKYGYRYTVEK